MEGSGEQNKKKIPKKLLKKKIYSYGFWPKPTANNTTLVEAEGRLSANDHHHHNRRRRHHHHHQNHHHYHYCLVRSYMFFLLNSSPLRQLPRLLN